MNAFADFVETYKRDLIIREKADNLISQQRKKKIILENLVTISKDYRDVERELLEAENKVKKLKKLKKNYEKKKEHYQQELLLVDKEE